MDFSRSRAGSKIDQGAHSHARISAGSDSKGPLWEGREAGSAENGKVSDTERVRVAIRVRPPTPTELEANGGLPVIAVDPDDNATITIHRRGGVVEVTDFTFDAVFPTTATQAEVFEVAARPVIMDVLNGYNGTIMAYGQTGAGKTYTLSNASGQELGIIPRAANEIFLMAGADSAHEYRVTMSYIQIYVEMIQDLIRPTSSNMQIREGEHGGVHVSGVEEVEVTSLEDCLKLLALGESNRSFAFTKLNAHSSRSHAIVMMTVEKRMAARRLSVSTTAAAAATPPPPPPAPAPPPPEERETRSASFRETSSQRKLVPGGGGSGNGRTERGSVLIGKLFLVDLAGSERLKKSGSEGQRANEAKSVNLSLTVLGKCINARADPTCTHVPFRDSKLTRLLQESLGGNAKTSLIINIAPCIDHVSESLSSLLFGSRAMKVRTKAVVNVEEEYRQLNQNLQEALDLHEEKLNSLEAVVFSQEEQLQQAKAALEAHMRTSTRTKQEMEEKHRAEREEMEESIRQRVQALEESCKQSLEDMKQQHRMELGDITAKFEALCDTSESSIKSLTGEVEATVQQRDVLAENLGKAKSTMRELERRLLQMGEEQMQERAAQSEAQRRSAAEDAAARSLQRSFRTRQRQRMQQALTQTQGALTQREAELAQTLQQKSEVVRESDEALAVVGQHMVAGAFTHLLSAMDGINRHFLTPRKNL